MLEPVEKTVQKRQTPLEADADARRKAGLGPSQPSLDFERPGLGQQYPIKNDVLWGWADYAIPGEDISGSEPSLNPDLAAPSFPTVREPSQKQDIPADELVPDSSPTIKFGGGGGGAGDIPPDEMQASPPSTAWWAPEPEYPTGGGYFSLPKTEEVEEVTTVQEDTPEAVEVKPEVSTESSGSSEQPSSFWSNWVDNSSVMSSVENVYNTVNTENRYITTNNKTDMLRHVQNNIDNRSYTYGVGEDVLAGVAGDLVDATVAIGGVTAGVTALTGALPGIIGTALLGAIGGLASGWGRGAAQGPAETVINVESPEVPVDDRYIGYGGGNSAGLNCAQMLQELLAAGGDATDLPPACKLELGIS